MQQLNGRWRQLKMMTDARKAAVDAEIEEAQFKQKLNSVTR